MYQWIRLNELYKLMGSLFQISYSFSNFWPKTEHFSNEYQGVNIDQITICYISMDLFQRVVQTYENLFFQFQFSFRNFLPKT